MATKQKQVKMSPPWDGYVSMLASFFAGDKRVRVGTCDKKRVATIEVFDTKMYAALEQILKKKMRFGNVTLRICLVPANGVNKAAVKGEMTDLAALKEVLRCNPAFAKFVTRKTSVGDSVYCLFKPVVLMWYNDNLASPYKQSTSVYEDAAVRMFTGVGASFATEPPRDGVKFCKAK